MSGSIVWQYLRTKIGMYCHGSNATYKTTHISVSLCIVTYHKIDLFESTGPTDSLQSERRKESS